MRPAYSVFACLFLACASGVPTGELPSDDEFSEALVASFEVTAVSQTSAQASWLRASPAVRVDVLLGTSDDLATATRVASALDAQGFAFADLTPATDYWAWITWSGVVGNETLGPVAFTTQVFPSPTVTSTTLASTYDAATTSVTFRISFSAAVTGVGVPGIIVLSGFDYALPSWSWNPLPLAVQSINAQEFEITVSGLKNGTIYVVQAAAPIGSLEGAPLVTYTQTFQIPRFKACVSNDCAAVTGCSCFATASAAADALVTFQNGDPWRVGDILVDAGTHTSDTVNLGQGISLLGGCDAEFTACDPDANLTTLTGASPMIVASGGTVSGFTIRTSSTGSTTAVRLTGGSPVLANNDIATTGATGDCTGVEIQGGSPTLTNNVIQDSVGACGSADDTRTAINVTGNSTATIEKNTIVMPSAAGNPVLSAAIRLAGSARVVRYNTIAGSATQDSTYGVFITGLNTTAIVSNIIRGGGTSATTTRAIAVSESGSTPGMVPRIVSNHIDAGGGQTNIGLELGLDAAPIVANNIFFANKSSVTATAVREILGFGGEPESFQSNLFGPGVAVRYLRDNGSVSVEYASAEAINALGSRFADNAEAIIPLEELFVDAGGAEDDLRAKNYRALASRTAALRFGKNVGRNTCGLTGMTECGGDLYDIVGIVRTAPQSVGAYEQDN